MFGSAITEGKRRIACSATDCKDSSGHLRRGAEELTDEWKVYQAQDITENWYILGQKDDGSTEYSRIDHYWKKVLDQKSVTREPRYKVLAKLVKACLCLAHGNAEVERSLS